jgi:hypothetical protein
VKHRRSTIGPWEVTDPNDVNNCCVNCNFFGRGQAHADCELEFPSYPDGVTYWCIANEKGRQLPTHDLTVPAWCPRGLSKLQPLEVPRLITIDEARAAKGLPPLPDKLGGQSLIDVPIYPIERPAFCPGCLDFLPNSARRIYKSVTGVFCCCKCHVKVVYGVE